MKPNGKFFISSFISLAFVFRLLAISFFPGSTAIVFPHTVSFKYKGLSSYQKRRRNSESNVAEEVIIREEEQKKFTVKSFVYQSNVLPGHFSYPKLSLSITAGNLIFGWRGFFLTFLQQQKLVSVSILRI